MLTFFKSIVFAVVTLIVVSCSTSSNDQKESVSQEPQEKIEQTGPEYTSAYICPMHCEGSGSTDPGKCPVCGMDYVANDKK